MPEINDLLFLAAFGLSSIMHTNGGLFELLRYIGAGYLLYIACKPVRAVWTKQEVQIEVLIKSGLKSIDVKGMVFQLSNTKVTLSFASICAVILPANISPLELIMVIVAISILDNVVFQTYALVFSNPTMRSAYFRLRRYFESAFVILFGFTGTKLLTAELA